MTTHHYPTAYQLSEPNVSLAQSLIEWPATTTEQAIYNEFVLTHVSYLRGAAGDAGASPSDVYLATTALAVLNDQLTKPRDIRIAEVATNILAGTSTDHPKHPAQWMHSVQPLAGFSERWFGPEDVIRSVAQDQPVVHWWSHMAQQCEITDLTQQVKELIGKLRTLATGPVAFQVAPNVEVVLPPKGASDVVTVSRSGWGQTNVNYTHEGLVLDVLPEEGSESIHTASVYAENLERSDADDSDLEPVAPGRAS